MLYGEGFGDDAGEPTIATGRQEPANTLDIHGALQRHTHPAVPDRNKG